MGDTIGKLFYGVELTREQYKKVEDKLFKKTPPTDTKKPWTANKTELDKKSLLCLEQPYETEDHYLVIRHTMNSAYNGGTRVSGLNLDTDVLDDALDTFLQEIDVKPANSPSWMLVGCYG